jgi:geranylgeranyl reductase family protein
MMAEPTERIEGAGGAQEFDVVVIGGGPAGSSAARSARSHGLRTVLIDKKVFPRDKLCGGLLTPRSKTLFERIFEQTWDSELVRASDTMSFSSRGKHLATVRAHHALYFCMRRDFDNYLRSLAAEAGVTMILGTSVAEIDTAAHRLRLSDGRVIGYGVLIGADGVNSQVAKALFGASFDQETIGFGLEVEIPRDDLLQQGEVIEVDFSAAAWGYGWVFPKKSTYTVGVGGLHAENPDMKGSLRKYLSGKGLNPDAYKIKGHFIPFGDYRTSPGRGNVLLVGDAAGAVDPITGEGIAYALETGNLAAGAAAAALTQRAPESAYSLYRGTYLRAVRGLAQANRWRYLIFPRRVQRLFEWAFRDAGTLQHGYLDILAGKLEYKDLYGLFVIQAGKALKKLVRFTLGRTAEAK